jgi:hypothetical protein
MNDANNELVAIFKALADANRLKIVGLLAQQPYSVEELAALLDLKAPTVWVAAGAEGAITRTRQHNHADGFVPASTVQRMDQFFAGLAAKGIHHLRAIDGDGGNPIARFEQNILIGHDAFSQPAMVKPPETLSTWPVT